MFEKLKSIFAKNTEQNNAKSEDGSIQNSVIAIRNWYEEKYDSIVVQRNALFVILLIALVFMIITSIAMAFIVNAKQFEPFVIQIDDTTGATTVVNPITSDVIGGNDALAKYFIKKYVISRETYNPVDFDTTARQVIRLLSTNSIYWQYLGYISNKEIDPRILYSQKNTTFLIVKSWSKLEEKKFMLRFSINETAGDKRVLNKIAVVDYDYVPMELTEAERDLNPIGFQVKAYRVDDDNS